MLSYPMLKAVLLALFIVNSEVTGGFSDDSSSCPAKQKETWSYSGDNGPEFWGERYSDCNGDHQSPIAITTSDAVMKDLPPLAFSFYNEPINETIIINDGDSLEIVPQPDERRYILVNESKHFLFLCDIHWGNNSHSGSEHTIDGFQYAMEMHCVHVNAGHKIAILAILFKEQDEDNAELQKIVDECSDVQYKDTDTYLKSNLNLSNLLPPNPNSYYRYEGSLTAPECLEDITWFVLRNPGLVGRAQMEEFRKLYSTTQEDATKGCKLSGNIRPLQPLNGRSVYLSQ